jgi:hypothetical protein
MQASPPRFPTDVIAEQMTVIKRFALPPSPRRVPMSGRITGGLPNQVSAATASLLLQPIAVPKPVMHPSALVL